MRLKSTIYLMLLLEIRFLYPSPDVSVIEVFVAIGGNASSSFLPKYFLIFRISKSKNRNKSNTILVFSFHSNAS